MTCEVLAIPGQAESEMRLNFVISEWIVMSLCIVISQWC